MQKIESRHLSMTTKVLLRSFRSFYLLGSAYSFGSIPSELAKMTGDNELGGRLVDRYVVVEPMFGSAFFEFRSAEAVRVGSRVSISCRPRAHTRRSQ